MVNDLIFPFPFFLLCYSSQTSCERALSISLEFFYCLWTWQVKMGFWDMKSFCISQPFKRSELNIPTLMEFLWRKVIQWSILNWKTVCTLDEGLELLMFTQHFWDWVNLNRAIKAFHDFLAWINVIFTHWKISRTAIWEATQSLLFSHYKTCRHT